MAGNGGSVPTTTKINKLSRRKGPICCSFARQDSWLSERRAGPGLQTSRFYFAHQRQVNLGIFFFFQSESENEQVSNTNFLWPFTRCSSPKRWMGPNLSGSPRLASPRQTRQNPKPQPLCPALQPPRCNQEHRLFLFPPPTATTLAQDSVPDDLC